MSSQSWVSRGQRVNKYKGRDSRWGKGKVHVVVYQSDQGFYIKGCRKITQADYLLRGIAEVGNVPKNTPLTCQSCKKKFPWLDVKRRVAVIRKAKTKKKS